MEVIKIIGVALIAVFIALLLKQYKPEFVIHISIIAGILIFSMVLPKFSSIIELLNNFNNKLGIDSQFFRYFIKNNRDCISFRICYKYM